MYKATLLRQCYDRTHTKGKGETVYFNDTHFLDESGIELRKLPGCFKHDCYKDKEAFSQSQSVKSLLSL